MISGNYTVNRFNISFGKAIYRTNKTTIFNDGVDNAQIDPRQEKELLNFLLKQTYTCKQNPELRQRSGDAFVYTINNTNSSADSFNPTKVRIYSNSIDKFKIQATDGSESASFITDREGEPEINTKIAELSRKLYQTPITKL